MCLWSCSFGVFKVTSICCPYLPVDSTMSALLCCQRRRPQESCKTGQSLFVSFPVHPFPCLCILLSPSFPLPSCPVHSAVSCLLRSGSLKYSCGPWERCKFPQWVWETGAKLPRRGLERSPGCSRSLGIFILSLETCYGNDFGSFRANQNVKANYIFQGTSSHVPPLVHACGRPQLASSRCELVITRCLQCSSAVLVTRRPGVMTLPFRFSSNTTSPTTIRYVPIMITPPQRYSPEIAPAPRQRKFENWHYSLQPVFCI